MARTVFAAPLYGQAGHLPAALESLLAQTDADLALLLVDDCSPDDTAAVAARYAAGDPRVTLEVNPRRLGMLANTRRAVALALERHPEADYVALASDHDLWDPRWLATLRRLLESEPDAVLAYPLSDRIDAAGAPVAHRRRPWRCDTRGIAGPRARLWRAYRCMVAGDMVYGLFRAAALRGRPFYRPVLVPDRLLLSELALAGAFAQAGELLWHRRFVGLADLDRQRRAFWPDGGAPAVTRLPWWLQHPLAAARAGGRLGFAAELLAAGAALRVRRRAQGVRGAAGARLEAPASAALARSAWFRAAVRSGRLPLPADTQDVLRDLLARVDAPR